jgi:phage terminase large subunit-like protein
MHHVGSFVGLEDEMVTWVPLTSTDSPSRVDALVWAATELLIDGPGKAVVQSLQL